MSTLDNFKKEAKRWLRALRSGDVSARQRLDRTWRSAPAQPVLRDLQHALALEHGFRDWRELKQQAEDQSRPLRATLDASRVATFLELACWDHHTHGAGDHRMHDRGAQRHLAQHPDIAHHDLYCAIVCGNLAYVRDALREHPEAARAAGGARGWTPLLYLTYTRLTHQPTIDNALAIARLLLDHGANPNDFYPAGDSQYSCLVGAAGEGEQNSPRQPYALELYRLLLDRGAGPYDIQVLYNTHFSGDMIWWLDPTYEHTVKLGRKADWDDPDWRMLNMGGYGPGAFFIINTAIRRNKPELAAWALARGANPNLPAGPSTHPKFHPRQSLYQTATLLESHEIAGLLVRHGATVTPPVLRPEEEFIAACMRLDRPAVASMLAAHPEYLRSHLALFEAARRDRADVVALLLDLGVPIEIEDPGKARALHHAAGHDALRVAQLLIDRGAEIDPRESNWNATPIGWASHSDHTRMLDLLSRHSRNVWTLAFRGYVDRLREVLRERPELARQTSRDGITPLWWLPDDDAKAMEVVELLLAAGADPAQRSTQGATAAGWARKRGMTAVAERLAGPDEEPRPFVTRIPVPEPGPADVPVEMRTPFPIALRDGAVALTTDVWAMLTAARDGNLAAVEALAGRCDALIVCAYNYMPPIHLAVREGHVEVVRYLAERGAVNPKYHTYPYQETLLTIAADRGFTEIHSIVEAHSTPNDPSRPEEESGSIDYQKDAERRRFEQLVDENALGPVEDLLQKRPELATDPFAFWSEGILMMPAHDQRRDMLDLLLRYGARVPDVTKWGREYYFKWHEVGVMLLERGMNPNHMNCHHTTLLHDMAQLGDVRRAALLLDHGATIDAVDREFQSTPLGFAARWGHRDVVRLLLDRGADRHAAGADWAVPAEWARRKGHATIAADLA